MRRISLGAIHVGARPGRRSQGVLRAGPLRMPVALGHGGIKGDKREGDGREQGRLPADEEVAQVIDHRHLAEEQRHKDEEDGSKHGR